ncbi:hypothetical protein [Sulfitobacter sp. SK012]|uniref:hypothetical protein n=1 Tax=Sulfitobacter sp. SK012 TaxID=1389005 RepID=UPI0013B38F88|nr:hypothetical protein [Sulfitobacter sp. SK012]
MTHPIEISSDQTLSVLRALRQIEAVENNAHIVPSIYYSWDAEQAEVALSAQTAAGMLVDTDVTVKGTPRWLTLNIGLGRGLLSAGDTLVLTADAECDRKDDVPLFIRSSVDGAQEDTELKEKLVVGKSRTVRTLMHTLRGDDGFVGHDAYHTLIFRLPAKKLRLSLMDLRLNVILAGQGARATPRSISEFS